MSQPLFSLVDIGQGCHTINDRGRTVALVSSQGAIDWLLRSPMDPGPLLTAIGKESHLSYTLGLQLLLTLPTPATQLKTLEHQTSRHGDRLTLIAWSLSSDGAFHACTRATISADEQGRRYYWELFTHLTCTAAAPRALPWVEYNNIYPGRAGRCFLFEPEKQYHSTVMVDRQGTAWRFPHQHLLHYSRKIANLHFTPGAMAGFFGDAGGAPVVVVQQSSVPPDWAICDMYYDLHCGARLDKALEPGQTLDFRYEVKYLPRAQADALLATAQTIPISADDRQGCDYPRLALGLNHFDQAVRVDGYDDASGFRPQPPVKIWDKETGHTARGSLRISHEQPQVTVWSAQPPSQIPSSRVLKISGMVKTQDVLGRGMFIRVRYHTFVWHPQPHVIWEKDLESPPISGSTAGWVRVEVPELTVPAEHFDYLVAIEVVLDGQGTAWLTDVDVDLRPVAPIPPALAQGSSRRTAAGAARGPASSAGAAS